MRALILALGLAAMIAGCSKSTTEPIPEPADPGAWLYGTFTGRVQCYTPDSYGTPTYHWIVDTVTVKFSPGPICSVTCEGITREVPCYVSAAADTVLFVTDPLSPRVQDTVYWLGGPVTTQNGQTWSQNLWGRIADVTLGEGGDFNLRKLP